MESTEIKASLNLDCIHLKCEMNTGHIDTLKYVPKGYNLGLSNSPKNAKNGPVLVKKLNYYWHFSSCINDQNIGLKFWNEYWAH